MINGIEAEESFEAVVLDHGEYGAVFYGLDRSLWLLWAVTSHVFFAARPAQAVGHWNHWLLTFALVMLAAAVGAFLRSIPLWSVA